MSSLLKYTIITLFITFVGVVFYNKVYVVKSTFSTIKPVTGDLHVTIRGIGNVDAKNIYTITAQSGGKIANIVVDEGEWVKKGDLLLSIDPVELPMLLDEAKLTLQKSKYEASSVKNNLESLEAQKILYQASYNRYEKLLEQKFVSQSEYDKAKSDLQNITSQVSASKAKIASAKSEVLIIQKSIEAIEVKLNRLKVYSPIDGYIVSKEAEKAGYVLPSTPIFKIVDPKTLWIKANIDERLSDKIKLMQKATIKLRSQPEAIFTGTLQRVVAISNAVTLEREVAVGFDVIPNPFYINEQAEISIEISKYENVLKIPLGLVVTKNGKQGVWVANGTNANFKPISVLAQNDNEAAVSSGIDANTELLLYTSDKKPLSDGMKIYR